MKDLSKLTKAQLLYIVEATQKTLEAAVTDAKEAADNYSKELPSQLAFEVGYLNGRINEVNRTIQSFLK